MIYDNVQLLIQQPMFWRKLVLSSILQKTEISGSHEMLVTIHENTVSQPIKLQS